MEELTTCCARLSIASVASVVIQSCTSIPLCGVGTVVQVENRPTLKHKKTYFSTRFQCWSITKELIHILSRRTDILTPWQVSNIRVLNIWFNLGVYETMSNYKQVLSIYCGVPGPPCLKIFAMLVLVSSPVYGCHGRLEHVHLINGLKGHWSCPSGGSWVYWIPHLPGTRQYSNVYDCDASLLQEDQLICYSTSGL